MSRHQDDLESEDSDYEACGDCGFDHSYEYAEAKQWHLDHPCSYCNYNQKDGHEPICPTGLGDENVGSVLCGRDPTSNRAGIP